MCDAIRGRQSLMGTPSNTGPDQGGPTKSELPCSASQQTCQKAVEAPVCCKHAENVQASHAIQDIRFYL